MKKNLIALLVAATTSLSAFAWPDKPITLVVPGAAGGSTDIPARLLALKLEQDAGTALQALAHAWTQPHASVPAAVAGLVSGR